METIVGQLAQQFGLKNDQAEAGAGAILQMLQDKVGGSDVSELIAKVPGAESWLQKGQSLPSQAGGGEAGGGLLGQAAGLLGGLGGGSTGAEGLGDILGKLQASGLNAGNAMQFVPALLEKIQGVVGPELVGKVLDQVPMLKALTGGAGAQAGGTGGLGGMLGNLLK